MGASDSLFRNIWRQLKKFMLIDWLIEIEWSLPIAFKSETTENNIESTYHFQLSCFNLYFTTRDSMQYFCICWWIFHTAPATAWLRMKLLLGTWRLRVWAMKKIVTFQPFRQRSWVWRSKTDKNSREKNNNNNDIYSFLSRCLRSSITREWRWNGETTNFYRYAYKSFVGIASCGKI